MIADHWRAASGARALAIVGSLLAHASILALIFWSLGRAPTFSEPPAVNLQLVRPWWTRPAPEPPPAQLPTTAQPAREPRSALPPVLSADPTAPGQLVAAPAEAGGALRGALRGLIGCTPAGMARLTEREREACADRLGAGLAQEARGTPARLNLDPTGVFAAEAVPYLARKPKNGCKVMAGGRADAAGKEGAVGGVGCAWSF